MLSSAICWGISTFSIVIVVASPSCECDTCSIKNTRIWQFCILPTKQIALARRLCSGTAQFSLSTETTHRIPNPEPTPRASEVRRALSGYQQVGTALVRNVWPSDSQHHSCAGSSTTSAGATTCKCPSIRCVAIIVANPTNSMFCSAVAALQQIRLHTPAAAAAALVRIIALQTGRHVRSERRRRCPTGSGRHPAG